jgi:lipopolysaccharide transport system permease protein
MSLTLMLKRRALVWQFLRRDILRRYKGTVLGLGWSFITPLLMLGVYTFVFRVVFNARWGAGDDTNLDFALQLYTGLLVFNLAADCLTRAPQLIVEQPNLVTKIVFPLEILAWVTLGTATFHALLGMALLWLAAAWAQGFQATMLLLPLVWLPLLPLLLGVIWFLAALGVFLRDIGQMMGMVVSLLLFLSPIFYPMSALPAAWRPLLAANPLTFIIEQSRRVVMTSQGPDWLGLIVYAAVACAVAWLGHRWFMLTRKAFADVI